MAALNYANQYSQALAQQYPYVLNFGALYATPNNGRYRWTGAKTVEIPTISTTGRVDANRDTIATASRNYDNAWEAKTLSNQRKWSTLVHPMDIDQTNQVASIANITQVYNEEQKFPEMDAYLISKIYADWTAQTKTADTTVLTTANILSTIDSLSLKMSEARVPMNGRILYCTYAIKNMIQEATDISRSIALRDSGTVVNREVSALENLTIIGVPSDLMKTLYTFTTGWAVASAAEQINIFMVHPSAVITPVSYQFAQLEEPSALSEGKYVYYEESDEDVFILNKRADAIQFNITSGT